MAQKILFLACTHGDETLSILVLNRLQKYFPKGKYQYDWLIANPLAKKKKVRFIDSDLNRSAPGDKDSKSYEDRRAYELMQFCKKFDVVIDLHSTLSSCGIVTILSKINKKNIDLAKKLGIKRNIIWVSKKKTGSLTQFVKSSSIGIECGPRRDEKRLQKELYYILKSFLTQNVNHASLKVDQEFYRVYGKKDGNHNKKVVDFVLRNSFKEKYYPFLANQYEGVTCYKLRKITFDEVRYR